MPRAELLDLKVQHLIVLSLVVAAPFPRSFMSRPDLEADVDQLADVSSLLIAEHKRLTGADTQPQLAEDEDMRCTKNLLYEPQPAADDDLVPRELPEEEEPVEQMADDYKDDFDE